MVRTPYATTDREWRRIVELAPKLAGENRVGGLLSHREWVDLFLHQMYEEITNEALAEMAEGLSVRTLEKYRTWLNHKGGGWRLVLIALRGGDNSTAA